MTDSGRIIGTANIWVGFSQHRVTGTSCRVVMTNSVLPDGQVKGQALRR